METIGHYQDCMRMREAAEYLGINYTTLAQSYQDKKIEPVRIGGIPYFLKADLDAYLARRAAREAQWKKTEARAA